MLVVAFTPPNGFLSECDIASESSLLHAQQMRERIAQFMPAHTQVLVKGVCLIKRLHGNISAQQFTTLRLFKEIEAA